MALTDPIYRDETNSANSYVWNRACHPPTHRAISTNALAETSTNLYPKRNYQLIALRPFNRRRIMVNRPFLSVFRAKKPERRFCTRREGRNVLRFTPRKAVAENERLWGGTSDEIDGVERADVEGVRERVWRRVGVERRVVEKGREERRVVGVKVVRGVNWVILVMGVRRADTVVWKEGRALQRRQSIVESPNIMRYGRLGVAVVVARLSGQMEVAGRVAVVRKLRKKIKRGAAGTGSH